MIIEDLDDFMKRNGIDTDTKEHSSKEKIGRLQGKIPSSKYDKYISENTSESEGTQKNKSPKRITPDDFDFDFDFPKRHKLKRQ